MKSLTIPVLCALLLFSPALNAQTPIYRFPVLETVYKHLDSQLSAPCNSCYFELAKKPDGYYVGVVDYEDLDRRNVQYYQLWSAATGKFLQVNLSAHLDQADSEEWEDKGHEGIKQKQRETDFNYFYGYENYTSDLIKYLEGKGNLKNNELEMLARAYSTEATNFIHPNISGTILSESKDLPTPDYEKVSSERVSAFLEKANKSIAYYEKIKQNDPNYKPYIIESIDLKINEDLMHYYMTMKAVKEDAHAQSFLDRIHFSDNEIAIAKGILDACEQESVYLPAGDTDSYPLWYIQDKLNYRKDISIIHSVLLYTSWYFDYVRQTTPVKFTLTTNEHRALSKTIVLVSESISEIPTYEQWLKELRNSKGSAAEFEHPQVPGIISFNGKTGAFSLSAEGQYFSMVDLIIMDLLANNPERKIYVAHPNVFQSFDLKENFVWRGPLFEFTPEENSGYWDEKSLEILKTNLTNPSIQYSGGSSPFDLWIFESWAITLAYAHSSAPEGYDELYAAYKKKINLNEVIKANQQRSVDSYKTILEANSSTELDEFLKAYTPTALKMIREIPTTQTMTARDLETLSFLHSLYLPSIRGKNLHEKILLTETQEKVAKELYAKLGLLNNLKANRENLVWSLDRLQSIYDLYEYFAL